MSSLGGMIRKGELNSSSPPIQHAVGIELYAHKYYYCGDKVNRSSCYRWPALTADSYALNVGELFGMDIACSCTCALPPLSSNASGVRDCVYASMISGFLDNPTPAPLVSFFLYGMDVARSIVRWCMVEHRCRFK